MPGGNICKESLEQRIERIRKRDEEIEKRHREAEADRLAALQANAMVKTTAPADEDWPKTHKYDKLDFTYDVKTENTDATDDKKPTDETRLQRPFKKFPEGQGPPADPTYNFLADAERDGKTQANNAASENKNWRANTNNSNNATSNSNRRNNANNNSLNRGRNGAKGKMSDGKKGKPSDEPILRKNDRERNQEPRMQRQKSSDGMWRRTDDKDTKSNTSNSPTGSDSRQTNFKADGLTSKSSNRTFLQQRVTQSKNEPDHVQQKLSDLSIEKRGNITVSVTKDGEVKSVKLETARAIGSGRVGGGQAMRPNMPPQQQHQQQQQQQQQFVVHQQQSVMDVNVQQSKYPTIDQFIPPQHHQQAPFQVAPAAIPVQTIASAQVPVPVPASVPIVNGVPFKLPSVQDRLIKNRVFFDDKLKNEAQPNNGKTVASNQ